MFLNIFVNVIVSIECKVVIFHFHKSTGTVKSFIVKLAATLSGKQKI